MIEQLDYGTCKTCQEGLSSYGIRVQFDQYAFQEAMILLFLEAMIKR